MRMEVLVPGQPPLIPGPVATGRQAAVKGIWRHSNRQDVIVAVWDNPEGRPPQGELPSPALPCAASPGPDTLWCDIHGT